MEEIKFDNSLEFSLKFSIFAVFDDLLLSNSMEIKEFFILHTIEFLQILYFCFHTVFESAWKFISVYDNIKSILQYFLVIPLFHDDFLLYRVVYYIITIVVFAITIAFIYLMLSLRKNITSSSLVKKAIIFISDIFIQILFIPFMHSFSIVYQCKSKGNANVYYPDDLICFSNQHIIMLILSSIGLLLLVSYGFSLTLFYCETLPKNNNIKARFFASYDKIFLFSKILIYYILEFSNYFLDDGQKLWVCSLTLVILFLLNFIYLYTENSYLNKNIMKILLCYRGIELFTSIVLVLNIILNNKKEFNGDFLMLLLGVLLLIMLFLVYRYSSYSILLKNENIIKNETELIQKFSYLSYLLKTSSNKEHLQMLKGYILSQNDKNSNNVYLTILKRYYENQDIDSSEEMESKEMEIKNNDNNNESAPLQEDNNQYSNPNLNKLQLDRANQKKLNEKIIDANKILKRSDKEEKNYILKYIEECYKRSLEKHPHSNNLKIHYLQYSIFFMKNYELASFLVKLIYNTHPLIEQQFILYRLNKKLEEEVLLKSMKSVVKVEISTILLNKKNIDFFYDLITDTTLNLLEFWDMISRNDRSSEKLQKFTYNININLKKIAKLWSNFQKKNIQNTKMVITYEKFMKQVLNDSSFKYIGKFDFSELEEIKKNPILTEFISFLKEGNNYVLASGSSENLGQLLSANSGSAKLLGYLKEDLLKHNLHDVIPDIMKAAHYQMLVHSIQNEKKRIVREFKRSSSLGCHANGYVIPFHFSAAVLLGYNEIYFVAFLRANYSEVSRKMSCHILLDTKYQIQNISSEFISVFGINNNNFKSKKGAFDICLLIKEMEKIKKNPELAKDYRYSTVLYNKKRIVINNTDKLVEALNKNSEKNKKVRLGEHEKHYINKKTNVLDQQKRQRLHYKEFFFSIDNVNLGSNLVGYHVILEPIKDEEYSEVPKLSYNSKYCHYSVTKGKFFDPNSTAQNDIIELEDGEKTSKTKDRKKLSNTVEGFLKYHGIKDYSHKVSLKIADLSIKISKLEILKPKIVESLYAWDFYYNNLDKFDQVDNQESDIISQDSFQASSETESFLNFKGIDGWEIVTKKIHQNRLPYQISFVSYFSVTFLIIQITLAILYYLKISSKYNLIHDIAYLKNLTTVQARYINDFMEDVNFVFEYNNYLLGYPHELEKETIISQFKTANESIYNTIDYLLETSNLMRLDKTILDDSFLINSNYTYYLSVEANNAISLSLNYADYVTHLINKITTNALIFQEDSYTRNNTEFVLLFINTMNIFQTSTFTILDRITTVLDGKFINIEDSFKLYLYISSCFIIFAIIIYFWVIEIEIILLKYLDLFFSIPPKISWKYYINCEGLYASLVNIKNNDNVLENNLRDENNSSNSESNNINNNINNEAEIQSRRKIEQTINSKRSQEERSLKASQSYLYIKIVVFLYLVISVSLYIYNYLIFKLYNNEITSLNKSSKIFFDLNTQMFCLKVNLYEKIYFTNRNILGLSNDAALTKLYQSGYTSIKDINKIVVNNRVEGRTSLDQVYHEFNYYGLCHSTGYSVESDYSTEFLKLQEADNICKRIPQNYTGFVNLYMFTTKEYITRYVEFSEYISLSQGDTASKTVSDSSLRYLDTVSSEYFYFSLDSKVAHKINLIYELVSESIFIAFKSTISKILKNINTEKVNLIISTVIYCILIIIFFIVGYLMFFRNSIENILFNKSMILLLDSEDAKTIKPIMTFLTEEINMTNSN